MNVHDEFSSTKIKLHTEIDRLAGRAQRINHEVRITLNRSAGQIYRQAKARNLRKGIPS